MQNATRAHAPILSDPIDNLRATPPTIKKPLFVISLMGTMLEYFEYAIYGFLAPILALHFFPSGDPTTALIKTFVVFAVGSMAKPLGALIFGQLGDHKGRRISLRYSMIGISIPTFMVGILPGYESWGWVAPLCLLICRLFQGMFIAGESDGVRIYIYEHYGEKYPCFATNLVGCGAYGGIALGSLVASCIPQEGEYWRIVFLGCSCFGVVTFILRQFLVETPPFLAYQRSAHTEVPLKHIFTKHWRPLVRTIMICGAGGGTYHFYLVFQEMYLSKILSIMPGSKASFFSFWLICLYIVFTPLAGWMADRWGLAYIAKVGGFCTLGLLGLNMGCISQEIVFYPLIAVTTLSLVFLSAPGFVFLAQHCDIGVRFRCQSLGHSLGSMLFSGTTPMVCLLLWKYTNIPCVPYVYFLALIMMGLAGFIWGESEAKKG